MSYKKYALVVFCLFSTAAFADSRSEIAFDALPEAVRNTVSSVIAQQNITQINSVTDDNGYVRFEIESSKVVNNKDLLEIDMVVAANGEIMKLSKETPLFDIPYSVMRQVDQRYPGLKVDEVELIQSRYFSLTGKANGQPVNLKIYDDGEIQEVPADQSNTAQNQPAQSSKPSNDSAVATPPSSSYQDSKPKPNSDLDPDLDLGPASDN